MVFDGGDPDKPIVIGSLYNGTHPPPFLLPGDKTRSGWRTQTSPGGHGFNEFSFEDAAAKEQIYLHAQRDLDEVVGRNHTLLARGDEQLRVMGSRVDLVERDAIVRVGHNVEEHVGGDHATRVVGNRIDVVTGNSDDRVTGAQHTRIEGKERRSVTGNSDLEYANDLTTRVLGSMTTIVGKQDKKRSWAVHAEGTAALSGLDKLELRSDKELVLSVGKSSIRITDDKIELSSKAISVKGADAGLSASDDGLALSSKGDAQMVVGKKLVLKTDGASISMEKEIKADASEILFNSPDQATDAPAKDPEPPTNIELADDKGNPLPYQRFLIVLDDKSEVSGMTDKDGKAELELKTDGKVTFPGTRMPEDQSGNGPVLPYVVRQGDYLSKLAFAYGFDEEAVWSEPKNAELKEQRKNPNILHPGDVLHFARPTREGLALKKGTANKYSAKVPTTSVRVIFKDEEGPFANEPYIVEGLGASEEGTAGGDGSISIDAPVYVREVRVSFPKKGLAFAVGIGDMDPVDEQAGVRKRLEHLGYRRPPSEGVSESDAAEQDRHAIAAFQREHGLEPTGKVDKALWDALEGEHDN